MLGLGLGLNKGSYANQLAALIKNCGLLSYATPEIDKVGKTTRDAVQGVEIIGDGSTYVDTTIIPNQNTVLRVWGNFTNLSVPSTNQRIGQDTSFAVDSMQFGIVSGNLWRFIWGGSSLIGGIADTLSHKFEMNNGEFFVDDVKILGTAGALIGTPIYSLFLNAVNSGGAAATPCNFNLDRAEIVHNGVTYTLDTQGDANGIYVFQPSDKTVEPILSQQFLAPATPTQIDTSVVSLQDTYGYTISQSRGKNKLDNNNYLDGFLTGGTFTPGGDFRTMRFPVSGGENLVLSGGNRNNWRSLDNDKNFISGSDHTGVTYTAHSSAKFVDCYYWNEIAGGDIPTTAQIELGSEATSFEAYQGYFYDALATLPIPQGEKIPNYPDGITSLAYISAAVHATAQYVGRCKYNFSKVDDVFKIADKYNEIITADTTNILYDVSGNIKTLSWAALSNITNDQLIINKAIETVGFYEAALTGTCKVDALKFQKLNEVFLVSDGEGGYETFYVDGELMYVLREGVTRE